MTALASGDVTVTVNRRQPRGGTKTKRHLVSIAFGDSALTYPAGGVPMPAFGSFGYTTEMNDLILTDGANGSDIVWKWDYTNRTLRAYRQGHVPPIVIEEAVTLTSNAGTLKYPPAYIIAAVGTISGTVQPLRPCPTGVTLAAKEMTVNWTTGAVTTRAADSVTAMKVSYIPQQPSGPFSLSNMAIDEVLTLSSSGGVNTASRAAAISYIYQTTATAARLPMGNAVASGVVAVDIQNSGDTTFTAHADQNAKATKVTYLKFAGFAQSGTTFIDQASIALTSEAKEWGKTAGDRVGGLIIPGLGVQFVGKETTNHLNIYLGDSTVTAAPSIAKFEIVNQKITTAESAAQTSIEDTPLLFIAHAHEAFRTMRELTVNDAPVATTLYAEAIGW